MTTGQLISTARKNAGMTQAELAQKLGISYVGISQWERDIRNPKKETLQRIADALDISLSELTGKQEETIGNSILEILRESGLTFLEVVKKTGIDPQKLFAIVSGEHVKISKEDANKLKAVLPKKYNNLTEALIFGDTGIDLGLLALKLQKEFEGQEITVACAEKIIDFVREGLKSQFRNKDESEYGKISWLLNEKGKNEAKKRARELTYLEEYRVTSEIPMMTEIPKYQRTEATQSAPSTSADTDTASRKPVEGAEAPLKSEEIDWGPPRGEEVW